MNPGRGVVTPAVVTDETAFAVVGLEARRFRAFVRRHGIPYARDGRRMLVRVDHFVEAIDRLSGVDAVPHVSAPDEATIIAMAARPRRRGGAA